MALPPRYSITSADTFAGTHFFVVPAKVFADLANITFLERGPPKVILIIILNILRVVAIRTTGSGGHSGNVCTNAIMCCGMTPAEQRLIR